MPNSRIPSPARSVGPPVTPRRYKTRTTRSVGSPARSTTSGRLSNIVDQFKENNRDSFAASPLSKTVLSDNTEIDMPRRQSWWKKVENSRDVIEVLEDEKLTDPANVLDEFDMELLTQEKKNYTIDLPECSDNESIKSIVVPQHRLFVQKQNQPQQRYGDVVGTSKGNNTEPEDKTIHAGTKHLFSKTAQRPKPVFPSALLNITADKTLANKTKELPEDIKAQPKGLFGRPGTKRKNMFTDFVCFESEDEIPEIVPKRFTFHKPSEPSRRSSNASSVTTDIDMDDWKLLPSSTMVEHQLEAQLTTPGKRARLSKLSEAKESSNTDSTKQSNKSISFKNKSKISPAKNQGAEMFLRDTTQTQNTSQNRSKTFNKTKSISQAQAIGTTANEEAKETSTVRNKTYNINQTTDKQVSKSQIVENVEDVQISDKTEYTEKQNASQNKSKTFNKTKNLSQAQEIPSIVNTEDKSNVENRTYNVNKTIDKQISKSQNYNISQENLEDVQQIVNTEQSLHQSTSQNRKNNEKYNFADNKSQNNKEIEVGGNEPVEIREDDEEIALTYEDNDPEELPENNGEEKQVIDNKTKTICEDNRLSKVSEYMDNIEKEVSKIVGYETNHILQMETPMPNKSVNFTKRVVEETPDSKLEGRKSQNVETFANKSSDKVKSQMIDQTDVEKASKDTKSTDEQAVEATTQEIAQIREVQVSEDEAIDDYVPEKEASEDLLETSTNDQDQAQASQEIEASDQEGTDAEQELDADEYDEEQQVSEEEEEKEETEEELEASQEEMENDEIDEDQSAIQETEEEIEDNDEIDEDQNASQEIEEEEIENHDEIDKDQNASQEIEEEEIGNNDDIDEEQNASQEVEQEQEEEQDDEKNAEVDNDELYESEDVAQNESQTNEEEVQNESEEAQDESEDEGDEQNESQEIEEEQENEEIVDEEEQNESQEAEEVEEVDQEMEEDVIEASEEMQDESETEPQEIENVTHDTTGRNRKKRETNTPEAILHDATNEMESFIAKGRNTSIRKTLLKNFTIRPSLAPARESTRLSDGTKNSSAEGSGWDSHRTTRKTLRQTFGKDFTPRKSLRALVMEKSAKRQTQINEANEALRYQANSTEVPEDHEAMEPDSDHEVSRRTRQTNLEMYLEKIKKDNMEFKKKIEQQVANSLKSNPVTLSDILHFKPYKPTIRRMNAKSVQTAPKIKRVKKSVINLENLPPEFFEDVKYKPPKRFKPSNAPWITKRLYRFLETKLEPKYDYKARVRAEKLVETIYNFVRETRKLRVATPHSVAELQREMARLNIVNTYFEFYNFFGDYLPSEVKVKVVPDIVNRIPLPSEGVFAKIIV